MLVSRSRRSANSDGGGLMGRQKVDQSQLFHPFNLEVRIPVRHLLRRINATVTRILAELREKLNK
jgi:hypothetical protein